MAEKIGNSPAVGRDAKGPVAGHRETTGRTGRKVLANAAIGAPCHDRMIRYSYDTIELAPGKSEIVCSDYKELEQTLHLVSDAIAAGELDEQIRQMLKVRSKRGRKAVPATDLVQERKARKPKVAA
jgi:hypothetical protein